MTGKIAKVFVAAALCALLVSGLAIARKPAKTTVTLHNPGGGEFYGEVRSKRTSCKSNRKVTLYKVKGGHVGGGDDQRINSDLAQANNNGYEYNMGTTGQRHGKFYARAGKINGCKADNSPVVTAKP